MDVDRRQVLKYAGGLASLWAGPTSLSAQQPAPAQQPVRSSAQKPIRVGQIGVGHAHASKLAAYMDSPDYEVVGIVEADQALRAQAETRAPFRDCTWMSEEQLLSTPGLQVVLVETHVRDLLATATRCIAAGKHIHLDKPAGTSLPSFTSLLQQAEQQQLIVQLGYMYRFNPAIVLLRQLIEAGAVGDVFEAHAVMSKVVAPKARVEHAEFSGGMMFELGCHLIDLMVGLLGAPERITPFAQHAAVADDPLLDNMLAVFEYPRALATVKTSAMEVEGFARRHLVVCGTKGTMHIQPLDSPSARLTLSEPHGQYAAGTHELTFPKFTRYVADAADMAQVLRSEKPDDFGYAHELAVQTAVLQASRMPLD